MCNLLYIAIWTLPQDHPQHALASLAVMDRKVKPIIGDRNCLVWALSFVLYGSEMYHDNVHEVLVRFISLNRDNSKAYTDGDLETQLAELQCMTVWGTAVGLLVAASLFQIPVFTLIPQVHTYRLFCYKPLWEGRLTSLPKIFYLDKCSKLTILSFSVFKDTTMTAFYSETEVTHLMSLLLTTVLGMTVLSSLYLHLHMYLLCTFGYSVTTIDHW